MKNSLCCTAVFGQKRFVEFGTIKLIRPVMIGTAGQYYSIYVTDAVYTDTGETAKYTQFGLFTPGDSVTYRGKIYGFDRLDRLCMVVENENNLAALESL